MLLNCIEEIYLNKSVTENIVMIIGMFQPAL